MHAEVFAQSFAQVYTLGPTFRAERSHTTRHISEFYMLEPEMTLCNLQKNMQCAEKLIKYLIRDVLNACSPFLLRLEKL
jgi:asparaginyl-tRNA synthetase